MQADELPPPAQMVLLLGGFRISQALYAAAALGVADQLVAGPAPVKALAERAGAHAPSLYRLLRTLASVGVFTEPEPGVFALNPLGQMLTSSQPGSMRDLAIMFMETHYAPFGELTHTIVDVGGANGAVLTAILAAHPQMRGVLFDLPHVITGAPQTLASHGVDGRAECVGGDFLESVPAGGDTYLVSLVLHDWPDQQAQRILANIAAAGGSGARLLMIEFVVPPGDTPHPSKMSDLNMLAMLDGKERTETEWRELLTAADFTGIEIHHTGTPLSVIQATAQ